MKKFLCALFAFCFCIGTCGGFAGCAPQKATGNSRQPITIFNADAFANYLKGYYYYNDEGALEDRYLFDKNFMLTQSYGKYSGNVLIPEYPEKIMADGLPYSVTFINKNGDFYSKHINTAYGVDLPADYFAQTGVYEKYYRTENLSGYAAASIDVRRFDVYPQFKEEQRIHERENYWTFPTADEYNAAKYAASGAVAFRLGCETLNNFFKLGVSDWVEPVPHIDAKRFEKLDISQKGDVVSFEIIYSDETISSSAKGTLNVSAIDFNYDYSETRYESDGAIIESKCRFELVSLPQNYTIDFNFDRPFEKSPDGFI